MNAVLRQPPLGALALCILGWVASPEANALPSFARQTGMPCSQCHTISFGPALTAYGRAFKLNGYTFGAEDHWMPLALMAQGGFTHTGEAQPDPPAPHAARNDNLSLDQVSVFLGSRVSEHAGVFAQGTYDGNARQAHWDNLDVRYARQLQVAGTDAVIGLSLSNNPSVQDLWNSTPAWGYPYISSPLAPGPISGALIDGGLAQKAIGATAYTMIHDHVYLEGGVYHGLSNKWLGNLGVGGDSNFHMNGASPYWRAAYQFSRGEEHYFSFGTFGLSARHQIDPKLPGTDRFTDTGLDATYQLTTRNGIGLSSNFTYIHEQQSLDASFASGISGSTSNHLDEVRIDSTLAWRQTWAAGLALFDVRGGSDATLYGPAPLSGSASGSPDTRGYVVQLDYVPLGKLESFGRPWVNVRVGLQYKGYLRFNGGSSNYDGAGRSASQNNTLFLFYWLAL